MSASMRGWLGEPVDARNGLVDGVWTTRGSRLRSVELDAGKRLGGKSISALCIQAGLENRKRTDDSSGTSSCDGLTGLTLTGTGMSG